MSEDLLSIVTSLSIFGIYFTDAGTSLPKRGLLCTPHFENTATVVAQPELEPSRTDCISICFLCMNQDALTCTLFTSRISSSCILVPLTAMCISAH